jgi:lysophospholipase L1-like esterase
VPHVVLLGDSIFDNAAYVRGGPDVAAHLAAALPPAWRSTLAAVDGAVIADVARQLARVPADATHLVVSAGGNDALRHADLLERRAQSSPQVLGWLADARDAFEAGYRRMLAALLARGLPLTVCTIYNGNLGPPVDRLAAVALAVFNDAILRLAAEHRVPAIELRLVCTEPADYANPIEPSVQGGAKIARAVAGALGAGGGADRPGAPPGAA